MAKKSLVASLGLVACLAVVLWQVFGGGFAHGADGILSFGQGDKGLGRIDASAEQRVALVIGNNNYQHTRVLNNAVSDAQAVKKELEELGFQVVYRVNADRRAMNDGIGDFIGKLSSNSIGLIYYSGHGVQINNSNYLIPTDLQAAKEADVVDDAIELSRLLDRVSYSQAKFTLAIIDACRNNPFTNSGRAIGGKGLAPPASNANGIMVVYAAGANQEALDRLGNNDTDPNGLFTRELLKAMRTPGLKVQDAVNDMKMSIIEKAKSVGHVQTPAIYDQSTGTFYFSGDKKPVTVDPPAPSPTPAYPGADFAEMAFWDAIKSSTNPADYQAYLETFPGGHFASLAKVRSRLQVASIPPKVAETVRPVDTPRPVDDTAKRQADALEKVKVLPLTVIQYALSALGYYHGTVDGKTGSQTTQAINAFQKSRGDDEADNLKPEQIVALMQQAAEHGQQQSENTLGMMLATGTGVLQDDKAAVQWLRRSASQGYATAKYNLALLVRDGRGTDRDTQEAVKLLKEAKAGGNQKADALLKEMK